MVRRCWQWILMFTLVVMISACQSQTAPLGFTPDGAIVKKAIALQFDRVQRQLSAQLQTPPPRFEITQINVDLIDPLLVANLPTYHLQGNYHLKLDQRYQSITQKRNPFDLYLQRQSEGETWRLLIKTPEVGDRTDPWTSYLIE